MKRESPDFSHGECQDLANMHECKHFEEREEYTDGDGCGFVYQGKEEDV